MVSKTFLHFIPGVWLWYLNVVRAIDRTVQLSIVEFATRILMRFSSLFSFVCGYVIAGTVRTLRSVTQHTADIHSAKSPSK